MVEENNTKMEPAPNRVRSNKDSGKRPFQKEGKGSQISPPRKTEEIKEGIFILGPTMGKKWLTSCEAFIEYASRTHGGSAKALLNNKANLKELSSISGRWTTNDAVMQMIDSAPDEMKLLIESIDDNCNTRDSTKYYPLQSFLAEKKLLNFRQTNEMEAADYCKEFQMFPNVAKQNDTDFCNHRRM
eukprot:jgi/Psemu1/5839/gm1.5839_g